MSANPNSVANQGEFHDSIPPTNRKTTSGHQLGQKVGHEGVPEFRAKTYPPGSAPEKDTFHPNTTSSIPGQALNPDMPDDLRTSALDIPGSTSQSVYQENTTSRPIEGQSSYELHHDGRHKRKHQQTGVQGAGGSVDRLHDSVQDNARKLAADLPEGVERKPWTEKGIPAEDRVPVSADQL
ncbi:hypothetical protein QBC35DRAFT_297417 [Podospora australis]|uniref:Uncharacterized protein n=1 Tax=Podospora australis TaxID=1536484 RepID=A0AAN6WPR0_9PEZI|nr:hypothetical protein QBC35DRAFT_297417 [Podospora australis]